MKEIKAYGLDLVVPKNYDKIITEEFGNKLKALPGFLGITDYAGGQTKAALFDSMSNRNKAYKVLSEDIMCAVIPETAHISR